jgi:isopenicillin-N epimerase
VLSRVTERTRLALLDHVSSPTGIVFPIARLVGELASHGVDTIVDGAHAPGMVPLDLEAIGAAYYSGNCHKWLCAPKGSAFLHVRRDRQPQIRPLAISHGANSPRRDRSPFRLEFDWTGTADPTPFLCVPAAIEFMASLLPGGWPAAMAHNRQVTLDARRRLCHVLGIPVPSPDEMIGSLASIPLPDGVTDPPGAPARRDVLQDRLFARFGIEVPLMRWPAPPSRLVRISAQLYNAPADFAKLAEALVKLLREERAGPPSSVIARLRPP